MPVQHLCWLHKSALLNPHLAKRLEPHTLDREKKGKESNWEDSYTTRKNIILGGYK